MRYYAVLFDRIGGGVGLAGIYTNKAKAEHALKTEFARHGDQGCHYEYRYIESGLDWILHLLGGDYTKQELRNIAQ